MNNKLLEKKKFENRFNSIDIDISKKSYKSKTFLGFNKNINSYINSKNFNIIKCKKVPYSKRKKNYFNYDNKKYDIDPVSFESNNNETKKKLINEINRSINELKIQDKEIQKYQDLYSNIKEQNKTNQYIVFNIMNGKNDNETKKENKNTDNYEKNKEQNNDQNKTKTNNEVIFTEFNSDKNNIPISEIKKENSELSSYIDTEKKEFFLTKTHLDKNKLFSKTSRDKIIKHNLFSPKNKKHKNSLKDIKDKKRKSQINFLRKELLNYNNKIDKDNKKLEVFKKKEKISKYIQAKCELDLQNKEIEDLIKIYND